jgi:hypothetical protein
MAEKFDTKIELQGNVRETEWYHNSESRQRIIFLLNSLDIRDSSLI